MFYWAKAPGICDQVCVVSVDILNPLLHLKKTRVDPLKQVVSRVDNPHDISMEPTESAPLAGWPASIRFPVSKDLEASKTSSFLRTISSCWKLQVRVRNQKGKNGKAKKNGEGFVAHTNEEM